MFDNISFIIVGETSLTKYLGLLESSTMALSTSFPVIKPRSEAPSMEKMPTRQPDGALIINANHAHCFIMILAFIYVPIVPLVMKKYLVVDHYCFLRLLLMREII